MKNKAAGCCLLACLTLVTPSVLPGQRPQQENPARLVAAINEFSLDLYRRLAADARNLCVSPASISTALLMAHAGARGGTLAEMDKVLCLVASETDTGKAPAHLEGKALRSAVVALLDRLNPPASKPDKKPDKKPGSEQNGTPAELRVVNALWGQDGYPFSVDYVDTLEKTYHARAEQVDFVKDRTAACNAINAWVDKATKGKIQKLISPGFLRPETRLVLTNAVYFKGAWLHEFQDGATKPAKFHLQGAEPVMVPTMHQTEHHAYFEDDTVQVLQMPYLGSSHALMILLPRKGQKLAAVERDLRPARLRTLTAKLEHRSVKVALPKFKVTSSLSLAECLADMGMPSAFSGRADFSGINDAQEPFWISTVLHKTYIAVDEEGTEAAAATAITMVTGMAPPTKPALFVADRPFLYLLRDVRTGLILFMGRVADPRSES